MATTPITSPDSIERAANTGMLSEIYAGQNPDGVAIYSSHGTRSFSELHNNANRLANLFRGAGLNPGDSIALLCENRPEFVEVLLAALRSGLRLTPVNWHLKPEEVRYIVEDCGARAFITSSGRAPVAVAAAGTLQNLPVKLMIGDTNGQFQSYDAALAQASATSPTTPALGRIMLYTSGTTGRPKGVYREKPRAILPDEAFDVMGYDPPRSVQLCCGPTYHAAPLLTDVAYPLAAGVPIVFMEKWDALEALSLIERFGITHTHMVPTMFYRLLALPEAEKQRFKVDSMKRIVHGAAPCPRHIKQAMIDWFGPVLTEYYAATEGGNGILISSEEWLQKPGSVGRLHPELGNRVVDAHGRDTKPYEIGEVMLRAPSDPAERARYHGDQEKTLSLYRGDHLALGDLGYVDEDGYLFLTGRAAECINSGGVNIYPQETDDQLIGHPAVKDVCTVGVPNPEWGEEVKAVVQLHQGYHASEQLAAELIDWVRTRLAHYKCPRSIDFVDRLPRLPSGKMQRTRVRARYWQAQKIQI